MRSSVAIALFTAAGLATGLALGWRLGRESAADELEMLRGRTTSLRDELADLESRMSAADRRASRRPVPEVEVALDGLPRGAVPEGSRAPKAAAPEEPVAAEDTAVPQEDPARRVQRVAELAAAVDAYFADGRGDDALEALKALAALAPEGREAAMVLAVRMNADVNGPGKLKLSQMTFYTGLADPAVKELMHWSLSAESPAEFREISVYSLPWTQGPDRTVEQFSGLLAKEKDPAVQQALVFNLARMRKPEADASLAAVLADPRSDPALRVQVATELSASKDPGAARAIETASLTDPDPDVRAAASAALVARNPPASGYLITGTVPDSQAAAAGLRAGDILMTYDGTRVTSRRALLGAARDGAEGKPVPVVVLRDGAEVTVLVNPGRLGVYGRGVQAGTGE